jgi:hypothetical protein
VFHIIQAILLHFSCPHSTIAIPYPSTTEYCSRRPS